jgi:F420-dependent oxidoreductase-like protein
MVPASGGAHPGIGNPWFDGAWCAPSPSATVVGMQLGLHLGSFQFSGGAASLGPTLFETARVADEAGVEVITLVDHYFQVEVFAPAEEPMLDGYTVLGFLAGATRRAQLGLLVTGVTYRHPGLLAKVVTTLDVVSGGRALLGLGVAWYEREHVGLGVPFPPVAERFERLEETLQICLQMWSEDDGPFEGRHYRLAETLCRPAPIQSPRPRILIGGGGERRTLRLVAQYADACNLFASGVDDARHKLGVLEAHCADLGRDPATIRRTMLFMGDPLADVDGFLRDMEDYAALGIDQVQVMPMGPDPVAFAERLGAEVLGRLSAI